ncbi:MULTISPECIES: MFS transporter [Burkholderia]|nr:MULTISPECIES: MFS transporter [Burkholderia]
MMRSIKPHLTGRSHRGRTDALILSGFPVGALLSAAVSYLVLNQLPAEWAWRVGFGLGTTMALVFFWIRRVIPESPRWLIQQGRVAEAEAIVEQVVASAARDPLAPADRAQLAKRYTPTRFAHQAPAFWRNVRELFGAYRARCALAGALNFSQAAVVYGVLSLMALVILPYLKVASTDMPIYYMIGNAAALAGGIVEAVLVEAWGRRASLFASYTFTVAAIVFIYAMHALPGMVLGYCLIQFGVTWAYISGYVVSSEILPTRIRATGLGVSVAIGRLGAVAAPLMLTSVHAMSGAPSAALVVLLVLALPGPLAAGLWWLNGRETRRISLEECCMEGGAEPAVEAAPRAA